MMLTAYSYALLIVELSNVRAHRLVCTTVHIEIKTYLVPLEMSHGV